MITINTALPKSPNQLLKHEGLITPGLVPPLQELSSAIGLGCGVSHSASLEEAARLGAGYAPAMQIQLLLKPLIPRLCLQLRPQKEKPSPCKGQPCN